MTMNNIQPLTEQQAAQCRQAVANHKKNKAKSQEVSQSFHNYFLFPKSRGIMEISDLQTRAAWVVLSYL